MRVSRSGLAWTLMLPGIMTKRRRHGPRPGADRATWRNGLIAWVDVARYIVGQIAELTHAGWAVVIVR